MNARIQVVLILATVALTPACFVRNLDRNAPGHSVIEEKPKVMAEEACEMPDEPGKYFAGAFTGIYTGLGSRTISGTHYTAMQSQLGVESSLGFGWSDKKEGLPIPMGLFPIRDDFALALNLGWTFLQRSPAEGQFYAEIQYGMFFTGIAFGWVMEYYKTQFASHHGPQTTVFFGPVYIRVAHFVGLRTDFIAGIMIKLPAMFMWNK